MENVCLLENLLDVTVQSHSPLPYPFRGVVSQLSSGFTLEGHSFPTCLQILVNDLYCSPSSPGHYQSTRATITLGLLGSRHDPNHPAMPTQNQEPERTLSNQQPLLVPGTGAASTFLSLVGFANLPG